jgi:hypothetical protein
MLAGLSRTEKKALRQKYDYSMCCRITRARKWSRRFKNERHCISFIIYTKYRIIKIYKLKNILILKPKPMYVVLDINNFNVNNIFYQEKVKNTVMDNSNFSRINYSNELFILNGIFIKFNLKLNMIEKSFNKYKCLFDIKTHNDIITQFSAIEKYMVDKHVYKTKTPVYRITEQLNNGFLKIFNEADCKENNDFILKIYGIWETECEYGLTYKFINI